MKKEIYQIPGHMVGHHHPELNLIVDTWSSLLVSLDEFRSAVYEKGVLDFAPKNGVISWIVDNSHGQGVYRQEVQAFIESTVAPKCVEIGIKFFFVVLPESALGKLSVRKVAKINANQEGMQTIEVASLQEALNLLHEVELG